MLLQRFDFFETARVARLAAEPRSEERAHELMRELGADDAGAEDDDVHVVVFDALMRGIRVVAHGRAHAGDLAGGDRRADAAAANQHAALGQAVGDREPERERVVRVVDGIRRVRADVEHVVSVTTEALGDVLLQGVARVVRADDDPHPFASYSVGRGGVAAVPGWP